MFLRRAACHEGRKHYIYWFILLDLCCMFSSPRGLSVTVEAISRGIMMGHLFDTML